MDKNITFERKVIGKRVDANGLGRAAMNNAAAIDSQATARPTGSAGKPTPAYVGASGKPNFARRNG